MSLQVDYPDVAASRIAVYSNVPSPYNARDPPRMSGDVYTHHPSPTRDAVTVQTRNSGQPRRRLLSDNSIQVDTPLQKPHFRNSKKLASLLLDHCWSLPVQQAFFLLTHLHTKILYVKHDLLYAGTWDGWVWFSVLPGPCRIHLSTCWAYNFTFTLYWKNLGVF